MKMSDAELRKCFDPKRERVGFVLKTGKLVELENISESSDQTFAFDPDEFAKYYGEAVATWHTHIGEDANLSFEDYQFFLSWPELGHFIISLKTVWYYEVEGKTVVVYNEADDNSSRALERKAPSGH